MDDCGDGFSDNELVEDMSRSSASYSVADSTCTHVQKDTVELLHRVCAGGQSRESHIPVEHTEFTSTLSACIVDVFRNVFCIPSEHLSHFMVYYTTRTVGLRNMAKQALTVPELGRVEHVLFEGIRRKLESSPEYRRQVILYQSGDRVTKRQMNFFIVHYCASHPVAYYLDTSESPPRIIGDINDRDAPEAKARLATGDPHIQWVDLYQRYRDTKCRKTYSNHHSPFERGVSVRADDGYVYNITSFNFYTWMCDVGGLEAYERLCEHTVGCKASYDVDRRKRSADRSRRGIRVRAQHVNHATKRPAAGSKVSEPHNPQNITLPLLSRKRRKRVTYSDTTQLIPISEAKRKSEQRKQAAAAASAVDTAAKQCKDAEEEEKTLRAAVSKSTRIQKRFKKFRAQRKSRETRERKKHETDRKRARASSTTDRCERDTTTTTTAEIAATPTAVGGHGEDGFMDFWCVSQNNTRDNLTFVEQLQNAPLQGESSSSAGGVSSENIHGPTGAQRDILCRVVSKYQKHTKRANTKRRRISHSTSAGQSAPAVENLIDVRALRNELDKELRDSAPIMSVDVARNHTDRTSGTCGARLDTLSTITPTLDVSKPDASTTNTATHHEGLFHRLLYGFM